jgi:hypothetical protein
MYRISTSVNLFECIMKDYCFQSVADLGFEVSGGDSIGNERDPGEIMH